MLQHLVTTAAQRTLTDQERAEWEDAVRALPGNGDRVAWEEDRRLSELLRGLPNPPVANNFMSRVLAAVERETAPQRTPRRGRLAELAWWFQRWPVAAASLGLIALAVIGVEQQRRATSRAEVARGMESFVAVSEVPNVEMLRDFDLIFSLPEGPMPPITELASALQ